MAMASVAISVCAAAAVALAVVVVTVPVASVMLVIGAARGRVGACSAVAVGAPAIITAFAVVVVVVVLVNRVVAVIGICVVTCVFLLLIGIAVSARRECVNTIIVPIGVVIRAIRIARAITQLRRTQRVECAGSCAPSITKPATVFVAGTGISARACVVVAAAVSTALPSAPRLVTRPRKRPLLREDAAGARQREL